MGLPIVDFLFMVKVLVDMIRVPNWAFEVAGQELRAMGQDTAYHPGLYLTDTQVKSTLKSDIFIAPVVCTWLWHPCREKLLKP